MANHGVISRLREAGFKVKTHEQWGSKQRDVYAWRLRNKPVDVPVRYGFLHITVTNKHGDEGARLVEEIGMERFGTGCSYNWMVDHVTHTIYQGQFLEAKGAHTLNEKGVQGFPYNLNYWGHAVAIMGDVEDPVCDKCVELIAAIFAAEQLQNVMVKGAHIYPHRTFAAKSCPGDKAVARLTDIHDRVTLMVKEQALRPPTLVEKANDLLEKAQKRAKKAGNEKRVERLEKKIEEGPKR